MITKKGFTLTELVIAVVVVGVLAMVAVPSYRGYVKSSIATEAKALLSEINAAEQVFYSRNGKYYKGTANQQFGSSFNVDARRNKYFTSYSITTAATSFIAKTNDYKGKSLTIKGYLGQDPEIIDNFSTNKAAS
jgi:type IV pilus assembly protein PilE